MIVIYLYEKRENNYKNIKNICSSSYLPGLNNIHIKVSSYIFIHNQIQFFVVIVQNCFDCCRIIKRSKRSAFI